MATARPPKGYARLLLVEVMADPGADDRARVFVEYETAQGVRSAVLSSERAKELDLSDAHLRKRLVPVPRP
jgi:2-methylcitrate dehydratase PrpD